MAGEHTWDVAVVGAGPAGSAAAYHLAERKHRVVMLERSVFPRDKACGDGLTRTSVELLADLELLDVLQPTSRMVGARLINRGRAHHDAPYRPRGPGRPGYGLVVPRLQLDDILRRNAMSAGAELWEGCRATDVFREGDRRIGVRGTRGGHQFELRSRFIVFADGGAGSLARQLDLGVASRLSTGFAMRGYYTDLNRLEPFFQMYVPLTNPVDGAVVPGYGWVFPLSDAEANIGVGFFVGQQKDMSLNLRTLFDGFLDELRNSDSAFAAMRRAGELRGAPLNCGLDPARCWGPQAVVIGDAAGLVDPFTGEGIDTALESGKCAAEVLSAALGAPDPQACSLGDYEHFLDQRFRDRFHSGRKAIKTYAFTWNLLEGTLEVRRPLFRALRETLLDYGTQEEAPSSFECAPDWAWLEPWEVGRFVHDVESQVASLIQAEYAILAQAAPHLVDPTGRLARIALSLLNARFGRGDVAAAKVVATAVELGYLAQQIQFDIEEAPLPPGRSGGASEPNWGNRFTVMVGAYLLAKSSGMFAAMGARAQALASRANAEACAGWLHERSFGWGRCPEDVYLRILPSKAGAFFSLESRLSGSLNGVPEKWIRILEASARNLGVAVHLQHEVRQLLEDEARGRDHPILRSLESGSFSLPMIRARLSAHLPLPLGGHSIDEQTVSQALAIVSASGALGTTWELACEFAATARDSLRALPDCAETHALSDLSNWLLETDLGLESGLSA